MTKAVKSYVYDDFSCQSYKLEFVKSLTIIMGPPYFVKYNTWPVGEAYQV